LNKLQLNMCRRVDFENVTTCVLKTSALRNMSTIPEAGRIYVTSTRQWTDADLQVARYEQLGSGTVLLDYSPSMLGVHPRCARFSQSSRGLWLLALRLDCYRETAAPSVCTQHGPNWLGSASSLRKQLLKQFLSCDKWPEPEFPLLKGGLEFLKLETTRHYNFFTQSYVLQLNTARAMSGVAM
jgi:hypothetical protein